MQQSTLTLVLIAIVSALILCSLPSAEIEGMESAQCDIGIETTQRSMTNVARIDAMKEKMVAMEEGMKKVDKLENSVEAIERDVSGLNDAVVALKAAVEEVQQLGPPEADVKDQILG